MTIAAEVISVGTELLLGDILNSNAQYLAQELATLGISHYYQTTVGDNPDRLQQVIQHASSRANLLIFTGGLGPTPDDLTTETIAAAFNTGLIEHPHIIEDITQKFAKRGRAMAANNRKQALQPIGADLLPNPVGTAPGMIWQPQPNLLILTFPGVPSEMKTMWRETAVPLLQSNGWATGTIVSSTLYFWGISESSLAEKVAPYFNSANPTVAPYANRGGVKLRISAKANSAPEALALITPIAQKLRTIAKSDCYGADTTLSEVVGKLLLSKKQTLSVAESCTGGGLGQLLTDTAGSSAYFWGGVIAYDNSVKTRILSVDPTVLEREGAVSEAVAIQMATGVRDRLGTDWGVSITGIAGPGGGTEAKPVGLVYIGIAGPEGAKATSIQYGDRGREWIRQGSAATALDRLRRTLQYGE
jgi:nicotinamide-nucleotide amidase